MKPIKKIALLHDLCGVGKAALTNMMPILSIMGIEAIQEVTGFRLRLRFPDPISGSVPIISKAST